MPLRYDDFLRAAAESRLAPFRGQLESLLDRKAQSHGREAEWDAALAALPGTRSGSFRPDNSVVTIGQASELPATPEDFKRQLKCFSPWRKGPWRVFGVMIDTEWRSDCKWDRITPNITALQGRSVLDVGCGNGYYLYRMLGEGARFALGVDPTLLYLYQFNVARRFAPDAPVFVLPLKSEQLPAFGIFDTVFSLGVLYHRRSPLDHLAELMSFLRPGGELVLETLVVDGKQDAVLVPKDRYAKMANVWFLPSTAALETWLARCGFVNVQTVDVTRTTADEQRSTEWMTFQSLPDFLDPGDPDLTIEGLPAPTRAIVIANKRS